MKILSKKLNHSFLYIFLKKIIIKIKNRGKKILFGYRSNISLQTIFEGNNRIGDYTHFNGKIGYASYIGDRCIINANIGKFSCIGPDVKTANGIHPTESFVSIHPAFFSKTGQAGFTFVDKDLFIEKSDPSNIGNDVWVGAGVTIVNGASIGDGAIIAAGAVVVKDVPPFTIWGGVPAKQIGVRFEPPISNKLEEIAWWDWNKDEICNRVQDFCDVNTFVEKYGGR